ncbi:MAG: hypothetical protein ABL907_10375 [Hyphomicrobium sp.]
MTGSPRERRSLPYQAYTECWYVPGEIHIVDVIHPDDGLTLHFAEDAAQICARHPDAQRMTCEDAWKAADAVGLAQYRKDVSEVTQERFMDALNVLPPVGWTTRQGVESFRISERIWGSITDIYARIGNRYFMLSDDIRLSPGIVADRVAAFAAIHPAHKTSANDSIAPERPDDTEHVPATPISTPKPGSGS